MKRGGSSKPVQACAQARPPGPQLHVSQLTFDPAAAAGRQPASPTAGRGRAPARCAGRPFSFGFVCNFAQGSAPTACAQTCPAPPPGRAERSPPKPRCATPSKRPATSRRPPAATPQLAQHGACQTEPALLQPLPTPADRAAGAGTQTDAFARQPLPPSELLLKRGVDAATWIEPGDLFDFEREVRCRLARWAGGWAGSDWAFAGSRRTAVRFSWARCAPASPLGSARAGSSSSGVGGSVPSSGAGSAVSSRS